MQLTADRIAYMAARPSQLKPRFGRNDAGLVLGRLAQAWVRAYGVDYAYALSEALRRHPTIARRYAAVEE
jgi:hypothetical protein